MKFQRNKNLDPMLTPTLGRFQEGALAKNLLFQFADRPYDLSQGLARLMNHPAPNVRLTVQRSIVNRVNELYGSTTPLDHADMVTILSDALRHRTTSVLSDEPICLANLLGLHSRVISKIPATDQAGRMTAFWELASNVPLDIIFASSNMLLSPGFRWAPTTFL
jgi:hypothetical protein